jgi:dolichol-phosphate mannosyltransferase
MISTSIWMILPALNEQEALPPLLQAVAETRAVLPNLNVIVIDDGSQDHTAQIVRDFNQPWIRLIQHPRNLGLAQGMRTGLAAALQAAPADGLIASMDADNTHQPKELSLMLAKLNSGFDVVIGSRFEPGAKMQGIPAHRQLFSNTLSLMFQILAHIRGVKDYSCGYRLYRATALRLAVARWGDRFITEQGFACMTEILLKLSLLPGLKFAETPMDLRYDRKPGQSKMNVSQNIRDTLKLIWRYRWKQID